MTIHKILIVDESVADRMALKNILLEAGYEVIEASSPQEAVEKAFTEKPALIFAEVAMQQVDRFRSCRKIVRNEKTKHIPILFVAGELSEKYKMWLEMSGVRVLIQKPYRPVQIIKHINQWIA